MRPSAIDVTITHVSPIERNRFGKYVTCIIRIMHLVYIEYAAGQDLRNEWLVKQREQLPVRPVALVGRPSLVGRRWLDLE